jgi:hypothetical protein
MQPLEYNNLRVWLRPGADLAGVLQNQARVTLK